ncbi:hypothetical protein ACCO45_011190 [Purpureocillium lilacinum]|uniref:Uncharacterized protein n=1 Tax=Purpureocillium lilacinum TaxID=33203 RepID=A0ACC4DGX6_PURLI
MPRQTSKTRSGMLPKEPKPMRGEGRLGPATLVHDAASTSPSMPFERMADEGPTYISLHAYQDPSFSFADGRSRQGVSGGPRRIAERARVQPLVFCGRAPIAARQVSQALASSDAAPIGFTNASFGSRDEPSMQPRQGSEYMLCSGAVHTRTRTTPGGSAGGNLVRVSADPSGTVSHSHAIRPWAAAFTVTVPVGSGASGRRRRCRPGASSPRCAANLGGSVGRQQSVQISTREGVLARESQVRRRSETLPWSSRASHLSVRPTGQGSWSAGEHGQCPTASQSADRRAAAPVRARAGDMGTRREIWRGFRSPGSRQRRRPMAVRRVSNISWSSPQGRSVGPAAVASLAVKEVSPILPMSPWSPQTAQGWPPQPLQTRWPRGGEWGHQKLRKVIQKLFSPWRRWSRLPVRRRRFGEKDGLLRSHGQDRTGRRRRQLSAAREPQRRWSNAATLNTVHHHASLLPCAVTSDDKSLGGNPSAAPPRLPLAAGRTVAEPAGPAVGAGGRAGGRAGSGRGNPAAFQVDDGEVPRTSSKAVARARVSGLWGRRARYPRPTGSASST